jgi:hypothetical protein
VVRNVEERVTEREQVGLELLVSQPEIVAWLGLSESELVTWKNTFRAAERDDRQRGRSSPSPCAPVSPERRRDPLRATRRAASQNHSNGGRQRPRLESQ